MTSRITAMIAYIGDAHVAAHLAASHLRSATGCGCAHRSACACLPLQGLSGQEQPLLHSVAYMVAPQRASQVISAASLAPYEGSWARAHLGASPRRPWTCCGCARQGACACPRLMGPPRLAVPPLRPGLATGLPCLHPRLHHRLQHRRPLPHWACRVSQDPVRERMTTLPSTALPSLQGSSTHFTQTAITEILQLQKRLLERLGVLSIHVQYLAYSVFAGSLKGLLG